MPSSSSPLSPAWRLVPLLLGTTFALASEPAAPAKPADEVVTLDTVVVTGSLLDASPDAVPVTVITADDIAAGGVQTNLLEVLRKQFPAFAGSGNIGLTNAGTGNINTYGGARLALHDMPTLVLLNGRRIANNGAGGRNGSTTSNFVDVSMIPLSAVERIEVLTDGASATYGSDAIGGVVNIILKPSYKGSEVGVNYGFSTRKGAYSEYSGWFATGASDGRLSVLVAGNRSVSRPLFQDTRPFGDTANTSSFSGVVGANFLNPSLNSPGQTNPTGPGATATMATLVANGTYIPGAANLNLAPDVTLLAGRKLSSAYAGFDLKLIDRTLEAFGDILYAEAETFAQLGAQGVTFGSGGLAQVPDNSPHNPINGNVTNVAFRYLPAPRQYRTDAQGLRFTAGLRGEIATGWDWQAAYTHSRNKLVNKIHNVLYAPNLSRAVAGGFDANGNAVVGGPYSLVKTGFSESSTAFVLQPALDPFARAAGINPASLVNILGVSRADFRSTLSSADAVVRGRPLALPAGDIGIALGGDYRTEKISGNPDENSRNTGPTAQRWSGGSFFDPFTHDRHVSSAFAELRLPVAGPGWSLPGLRALDLTAAYRIEDYSDAGESRVPKYGVRWQPLADQVTFRYTYSKGFAAPTLFALFGAPSQGSSSNISAALGYTDSTSRQVIQRTGANPDLRPTTSKSDSVGVVLTPKFLPGLRLSVDYLDVRIDGQVGTVGTSTILQSVNQLGSDSPYAGQVTLNGNPITTPVAGQIRAHIDAGNPPNSVFVADTRRNLAASILRIVDTKIDYTWKTKTRGEIELGTAGTWFLDDKTQSLPTERFYEYAGHATSAAGTIPGYRFYSTAAWRLTGWEAQIAHTHIASVDDIGSGGLTFERSTTLRRTGIPSFTAWDISLARTLTAAPGGRFPVLGHELNLRLGVNNVFDKLPPAAPQAFPTTSAGGADSGTYGAIGRLWHITATLKF